MDDVETFLSEVRNGGTCHLCFNSLSGTLKRIVSCGSSVGSRLFLFVSFGPRYRVMNFHSVRSGVREMDGNPLIQRLTLPFPGVEQAACHQGAESKKRAFSWNLHQPSSPRNGGCERGKLEQMMLSVCLSDKSHVFFHTFSCFFNRSPCGHSRLGSTIRNFGTWKLLGHLSRAIPR